ncbi:glycoside hydrolase family 2 protein [uncultured Pseudokineococcus sp.]|uniref:glycoside hydrolase family 2 protein n=1 Tax=uncultured Pseudokineococcus sp. TaxID=1642928 RepID=UPI00260E58E4|nr:glycoside hydrolase family 2 TIM barrel-domain containing protein [uncultured Pseudokineococcus sp.]
MSASTTAPVDAASTPDGARPELPRASAQDGTHPRPQMLRAAWASLDGTWAFRHDDADEGLAEGWGAGLPDAGEIRVPFPPESAASGVEAPGFHPVVWYSRRLTRDDLVRAGAGDGAPRVLLHLGAVDHSARVWVDGVLVGEHAGGHTPFTVDVTAQVGAAGDSEPLVVVRAEDDPLDATQPRGKQDWHEDPHAIWYRRTTGIWQTVWLEAVPSTSVEHLQWLPVPGSHGRSALDLAVRFRGRPAEGSRVRVVLRHDDEHLAELTLEVPTGAREVQVRVPVARQRNGQAVDEVEWSPEHPRLVDAVVALEVAGGSGAPAVVDAVSSYVGLRTAEVAHGAFLLNGHPYDVRSVLNQGYWPESHLAAPSAQALRREVELIRELGFNACRVHQKVEDPRFLFWADRLGLLVWGEAPGAYEFSPRAVHRLVAEWMEVVDRDASHPCVVTWVPFNESWGIQQVRDDPAQQAYARALTDLTRALDPTRPVVCNDGWEQQSTDITTVHDYEGDGAVLARTYADEAARDRLVGGLAPSGRAQFVGGAVHAGQPVMLTEFGGISFQPGAARADAWGYTAAQDAGDWTARIGALYDAVRASTFLAGSCYTQLTDTEQETNGLLDAQRRPKAPVEDIRRAVLGGARDEG